MSLILVFGICILKGVISGMAAVDRGRSFSRLLLLLLALPCVTGYGGSNFSKHHAAGLDGPPGGQHYDLRRPPFLNLIRGRMTKGFLPPMIARELYGGEMPEDWVPKGDMIEGFTMHEEDLPMLDDEREADGVGEKPEWGTQFFLTEQARDDFCAMAEKFGISAATNYSQHDYLLHISQPRSQWPTPQIMGGAYGVMWVVAKRCGATNPAEKRLHNDAVSRLRQVVHAHTHGDDVSGKRHLHDFFKRYGTHFLPGPFRFGGLIYLKLNPARNDTEELGRGTYREEAIYKGAVEMLKHGVRIRKLMPEPEELEQPKIYVPSHAELLGGVDPGRVKAELAVHVSGGDPLAPPPLIETPGDMGGWLGSVRMGMQMTTAWQLTDRGVPVPVWELIDLNRDPFLSGWLKNALKDAYIGLLRQGNPHALHNAAEAAPPDVVHELLRSRHFLIDALDHTGRTPLQAAIASSNIKVAKLLLQQGASPGPKRDDAKWKHKKGIAGRWEEPIVFQRGKHARTTHHGPVLPHPPPLHMAAEHAHVEIIKLLLEAGADAWAMDSEGRDVGGYYRRHPCNETKALFERHSKEVQREL